MSHRVYISSSTQAANEGVANYGTEQDRMMQLSDRVKYWLDTQKRFTVFRNKPGWSLKQTVDDCNSLACEIFIDNHTNAGPAEKTAGDGGAEGTEVFYYGQGGTTSNSYKLSSALYKYIAPESPGKDRGVLPDTNLYKSGLYVVQNTNPPAAFIEHIFHTNYAEVADFLADIDAYAKAEAKAICEYFGEKWEEPGKPLQTAKELVKEMIADGIVTDAEHWEKVLKGEIKANPEYLQVAFRRATQKIK